MTASVRRKAIGLIAVFMLMALTAAVRPQEGAPPAEEEAPAAEPSSPPFEEPEVDDEEFVLVNAERIVAVSEVEGLWRIDGDVEMQHKGTKMYSSHCDWYRNEDRAVMTGGVRIKPKKHHEILADQCDLDLDKSIALLTSPANPERVTIITKKTLEPDEQAYDPNTDDESTKYEQMQWVTHCDQAWYNYDNDSGEATGNIVSISEDGEYTVNATKVLYSTREDGDQEIRIPDNPLVTTLSGEEYRCSSAVVLIDEETDRREVTLLNPSAHIKIDEDEEGGPESPESAESGAAAGGPPPSPPPDQGAPGEGGQG